ncbi:flagellar protein FlgN [Yoonia maritima]|uniref:flagellar protein FlgN n=1 Tax=Yoonia maritima TaxID=1435347 RepID=UPI00373507B8
MHETITQKLLTTLNAEKAALCSGSFDALDELSHQKYQQFEAFSATQPTGPELQKIQRLLSENQTLISAAIAGVQAARARVDALQNVRSGLSVYDQSGALARVSICRPDVEKKA